MSLEISLLSMFTRWHDPFTGIQTGNNGGVGVLRDWLEEPEIQQNPCWSKWTNSAPSAGVKQSSEAKDRKERNRSWTVKRNWEGERLLGVEHSGAFVSGPKLRSIRPARRWKQKFPWVSLEGLEGNIDRPDRQVEEHDPHWLQGY